MFVHLKHLSVQFNFKLKPNVFTKFNSIGIFYNLFYIAKEQIIPFLIDSLKYRT